MTPDAAARYSAALALTNERRYHQAHAALERAQHAAADPDLAARIAGTRAFVLDQLGRPDEGEALCRSALAGGGVSAHTRGVIAGQLGSILMHRGRLDEAARWLGEAIAATAGEPLAMANLRMNRSVVSMQRHELAETIDDLEAALAVYEQHGNASDVAEARHNLGYTALLGGDLLRAIGEMAAARTVLARRSPAGAAIGDVDMAEALREAGLVTEAERLLRDAAQAFRRSRMPQARAEAELQLARSLLRHDRPGAARAAESARRHFRALGSTSWADRARAIWLRARMSDAPRRGPSRVDTAVDAEVTRLAARLSRQGLRSDALCLRLTRELRRARQGAPAGRIAHVPATATLEVRMLAHEVRAERAAGSGRNGSARRHAAVGLAELAGWRSSFGSLDLQTSLAMHGRALMLCGLGAAVRSGRPDVLFEWSERARQLSVQVLPLRPPEDPAQAAELSELRMLRADAVGGEWAGDPRVRELSDRLRRRQWAATGSSGVHAPVGLADAAGALDADTAVLSYVFSAEGLCCLVVTGHGASVVALPEAPAAVRALPALRSDLDMSATIRSGPMVAAVRGSLDRQLQLLSRTLLEPVVAGVDARRIVITSPGVLAGLPWTMLPGLTGRPITVATSISRWVRDRPAVLAPRAHTAAFAVGPQVARGGEEVAAAAAEWPHAAVLSGPQATVAAVTEAAAAVEVLHISAHGRHALDNPLFSGVQLADGPLFGYDIDALARMPGTVVLSACESGRSTVRWGEEAVGMTRAWLHAGTRAVVATPVVVADTDACELLSTLHRDLAAGAPPAEALAAATASTGIRSPFLCHGNGF